MLPYNFYRQWTPLATLRLRALVLPLRLNNHTTAQCLNLLFLLRIPNVLRRRSIDGYNSRSPGYLDNRAYTPSIYKLSTRTTELTTKWKSERARQIISRLTFLRSFYHR